MTFNTKTAYHAHFKINNCKRNLTFKCQKCPSTYNLQCKLTAHVKAVHASDFYVCVDPGCGMQFTTKLQLKEHRKIHVYKCQKCVARFKTMKKFENHSKSCNPVKPTPERVKCPICSKECSGKGQLATHMFRHKEKPEFTCDICGVQKKFYQMLISHMEVHISKFDSKN